ncbi:DUF1349 domain-containing protein [Microbacterium sp. ABRD28]|uniref:DUF1349 domain-containing protein n=1 Tax=Microbacterium sp. ABRD28 TaxID=2268461 RepID=UPI000F557B2B|nr:DUF1349 domain-containing protein [Microbacterium sp. ABRD28]AZC12713.1 DUF1349 domain-containing protein [Microbacterium sp. ABRD28]
MSTSISPRRLDWSEGRWTHEPVSAERRGDDLVVTAVEGSDAWLRTAYGFEHASEHGLIAPFPVGSAMEVEFTADFTEQFDQAGIFVRIDEERWIKSGVEFCDGELGAGAVVTDRRSDWSVGAVPGWSGHRLVIRVSRGDDAITVRGGVAGEPMRLLRLAPFDGAAEASAGPLVAAPSRAGLTVVFHSWRLTEADASIH